MEEVRSVRLNILVKPSTMAQVEALSRELGWSKSKIGSQLIEDGLEMFLPVIRSSLVVRGLVHKCQSFLMGARQSGQVELFEGDEK